MSRWTVHPAHAEPYTHGSEESCTKCGIPHLGNHRGPRVHDIRHTFAVHSLGQMAKAGMDLYTAMPVLSTCLGHKSLSATEQYVRLTMEEYPALATQTAPVNAFVYPKVRKGVDYEEWLNRDNVTGFLLWVKDNRKCSNATRNYRLAAISSFALYLQYEDVGRLSNYWQQILNIKALKTEKRNISYLTLQ